MREPVDEVARSKPLTQKLVEALPPQEPFTVLDLGTGTGANVRYLMDRLPASQRWLLVDNDAELLGELPERMSAWGTRHDVEVFSSTDGMSFRSAKGTRLLET